MPDTGFTVFDNWGTT